MNYRIPISSSFIQRKTETPAGPSKGFLMRYLKNMRALDRTLLALHAAQACSDEIGQTAQCHRAKVQKTCLF